MSIDNVCRYLSEQYPKSFATWLLDRTPADVKDLKTELSVEPVHRFRSIRIWEQDPTPLLASVGLLPLAVLARTDAPESLRFLDSSRLDKLVK
ncbi:hypothetical protein A4S05_26255 [Nostoc sp. KVJ20]|uniref:hypothetical protein n=1 Tax=Nostoc sp. KVJ20 TaxID=457944 RepID=UPI00083DC966|nr:hypothetical protein [Nostoc sp. KVJ20]ODH01925.1 hypothetical protein A4S05_26255 [Nostoc sp. KVJ20]